MHFMHCRNVRAHGRHALPRERRIRREFGDVDMRGVLTALREIGFAGPMRPDHGRMIWGERGAAGYGLYDRALGATYLQGLWEGDGSNDVALADRGSCGPRRVVSS